jgi:hypothetical protein
MNKNIQFLLLILPLITITLNLSAQGWVMEDRDGSTTYMLGDWVKVDDPEEEGFSSIYNLSERILIIVNPDDMSYAEGTIDDYCQALSDMTSKMMEGMTEEQKEMMEAYMKNTNSGPAPDVKVQSEGSGENVAGYSTEKYSVMVDGELFQEVWISRDGDLKELVNAYSKVEPITREMVGCSSFEINLDIDPEYSEAYLELMRSGLELKSIRYEYGSPDPGTDIVRLEKASLSKEDLMPPAGYKKLDFQEFMSAQQGR